MVCARAGEADSGSTSPACAASAGIAGGGYAGQPRYIMFFFFIFIVIFLCIIMR
jgi:hypothetical protein